MNVGNRMGAVRGAVRTLWGHTTVCAPWGTSWTMTTTPVWMLTSAGPTSSTVLMNVSTWRAALDAPASMVTTCRMMGNPVKVRKEQPVTISSVAQKHHYITIHMMLPKIVYPGSRLYSDDWFLWVFWQTWMSVQSTAYSCVKIAASIPRDPISVSVLTLAINSPGMTPHAQVHRSLPLSL